MFNKLTIIHHSTPSFCQHFRQSLGIEYFPLTTTSSAQSRVRARSPRIIPKTMFYTRNAVIQPGSNLIRVFRVLG